MILMIDREALKEKLKRRHGILDDLQDDLLDDIIEDTMMHYLAIANRLSDDAVDTVPIRHSFIIADVASIRYIRRGSEGMEIERVDGYQATYKPSESDFSAYYDILDSEYSSDSENSGRLTFY